MTGEFTNYCNYYYHLTVQLAERERRLQDLLDNAPAYCGQINLTEIDAIISYYRETQAAKKETDKTLADMRQTERIILIIMRYFEIPPDTVLTGEIPEELEYNIWADEIDMVHIRKIKELAPEADNPNIIVIKLSGAVGGGD